MADYLVQFTMLTNTIPSNPIPLMVVLFLLVLLHWQEKCQKREGKGGQTEIKIFQAQVKT